MIDVHLLTLPGENSEWLDQCLASLKDEPITLHQIDGVPGHIGRARFNGFQLGDTPYVSYVDPDDYIEPGIFQKCQDVLDGDPSVTCAGSLEVKIIDGEMHYPTSINHKHYKEAPYRILLAIHHIVVYRREKIAPYLHLLKEWRNWPEPAFNFTLYDEGHKFHIIDEVGYYWRKNMSKTSAFSMDGKDEAAKVMTEVYKRQKKLLAENANRSLRSLSPS